MTILSSTPLDTEFGVFSVNYHKFGNEYCLSITKGTVRNINYLPLRIHSSCLFSEALHSIDCDCNLQLTEAMKLIEKDGKGVIIYIYQEGRGHGLEMKIRSMSLENRYGLDTVEAFNKLGLELDPRDYTVAIKALKEDLKIGKKVKLITNNPRKRSFLENAGFVISERINLAYRINNIVKKYLETKKDKLGHEINLI